jgi:hypothetical protein
MELEDYGEIRHKHTHIHTVPKIHQRTLNTALKDWCLEVFDEEKCKTLNESNFDEILTGSNDSIHLSKTFSYLLSLEKMKSPDNLSNGIVDVKLFIKGTQLFIKFKKGEKVRKYKSEIMFDGENNELFSYLQVNLKGYGELSSIFGDNFTANNIKKHPLQTIKVTIQESGFFINGIKHEGNGSTSLDNLKEDLMRMNLKVILDRNNVLLDEIDDINQEINSQKIESPDNLTPKRNMENLEKLDNLVMYNVKVLFFYFLIGIAFGIYCIYFFFVVELK